MTHSSSRRTFLTAGAAALAGGVATGAIASALPAGLDEPELEAAIAECHRARAACDQADEEVNRAFDRWAEMGGIPDLPEAAFFRDGDLAFGITHSTVLKGESDGEERHHVSAFHVEHLRRVPRKQVALRWRPIPADMLDDYFVHRRTVDGIEEYGASYHEPWPEAQARADEILAAWDARAAEDKRRNEVSGLNKARKDEAVAMATYGTAKRQVVATPARTQRGIALKAGYMMTLYGGLGDLTEEISDGGHTTDVEVALSIVRDLVRLGNGGSVA